MALFRLEPNEKFIKTEPLSKSGQRGERKVWEAVKLAFAERNCIAYWRYPIFSKVGQTRKEADILIADVELGLIVIEVKSIAIDQIVAIHGHRWEFQNFYAAYAYPYEQAEHQLFGLLGYCDREPTLRRKVTGRAIVALPLITQTQWETKGLDQLPSCPPILFQDCLLQVSRGDLIEQVEKTIPVIKGRQLNEEQWKLLLAVLGGSPVYRKHRLTSPPTPLLQGEGSKSKSDSSLLTGEGSKNDSSLLEGEESNNNSSPPFPRREGGMGGLGLTRSAVLAKIQNWLSEFDLQQELIGKQIPPGPQRIRGIAGSGKTVLLCQKAAHMHLKYPDWDIALVFFSRSLYEPIIKQLDKWLRRFSSGEVEYNSSNQKLRVLHAWGAKNQPGLYSMICEASGVQRLSVYETDSKQPNESLAEVCRLLLKTATIPKIFDAILIDEGQDLIVDDELKVQDKQPFYWMAYQALRPVNMQHPEQRRLIWTYDEAQSLSSLNVPTAGELLGDELAHLVTGFYPGGIKKSEVIHKCYRTPGPIVTAAHGISMGLLRPWGMLSGVTRTADWQAMGYEVTGRFTRGQQITLRRLSDNFPNQIPQLWKESVIGFEMFSDRQTELSALSAHIWHNLKQDCLNPSREILVIVLGHFFDAARLESHAAEFLMSQGINIFIPGNTEPNVLKSAPENRNPNQFWCEGAVTISRIHRAKGNEADMVYIIGCDNVAREESNVTLRNQLFVALTRAKGWVKLSGIGKYPMYEEIKRVIDSGDTFNFTFDRRPTREISVTDAGELLKRYAAGGRNFQGIDLREIQLAGANLRGANLIGTLLNGADLRKAYLDGIKLVIADLSNANLSHASLRKAKLMGAILRNANLSGADLSYADLSDADLSNAKLVKVQLVGANLSAADLTGADLTGANLNAADLNNAKLTGAIALDNSSC